MPSVLVYLTFIFGIFTITEQKNKPVAEIQKLLDFLGQKDLKNRVDSVQKVPYHSGHQNPKRHNHRGDENNPNLMNIQTLNLFYKHNNLRNKKQMEDGLEQALRFENDRDCKSLGRCGCRGPRCGRPTIEDAETVDDIGQLLDDLNKDLNRKRNERDGAENKQDFENDRYENEGNLRLNKNDINKLDDDLDIIFLEVPDSEEKTITDKLHDLSDDIQIVDLRDLGNLKSPDRNSKVVKQNVGHVTPEDLANYYEQGKRDITNSLLKYVKGTSNNSYLSRLLPYQRKQLNLLKTRQSQKPIIDDEVKTQIVQLLYGSYSNNKILPQSVDNNIYVPQRIYDGILSFKNNNLRRAKKNIFPLTSQQKERLQNKVGNIIPKISGRRSYARPKYGVPFDFEIQGLGQII